MGNQSKNKEFLFGKVSNLLSKSEFNESNSTSNAEVSSDNEISQVLKINLTSNFLGEKSSDEIKKSNFDLIEKVANKSFLNSVKEFSSNTIGNIKLNTSTAVDFALIKTAEAKQTSKETATIISKSFIDFSSDLEKKYDHLKIKPKLLKLIYTIDLKKIINSLDLVAKKQTNGSKEQNALTVVLSILNLLEKSKINANEKDSEEKIQIDNSLNQELKVLLKSVKLKDVLITVEPFLILVPSGNYIILILKLFL